MVKVVRLGGPLRIFTAIAVSQDSYPTAGSAKTAVFARSDLFPDALAGTPLAVVKDGPLLLTPPSSLDPNSAAELQRVLPSGGTVYVLGDVDAISPATAAAIGALGYNVVRFGGPDRYGTAIKIAVGGLNSPSSVLLATGIDFPDALAGGAAAAKTGSAVLLTTGSSMPASTASYLSAHPGSRFALGGPAAAADPSATPVVGFDRYDTARKVAEQFFSGPAFVGVARGDLFPDSLSGGAHIGKKGGPMLLTAPFALSSPTSTYLSANKAGLDTVYIYGGTDAVSAGVQGQITTVVS